MLRVDRPWGFHEVLYDEPGMRIKRLVLRPDQKTSLQLHHNRDEFWLIRSGEGCAYIQAAEKIVRWPIGGFRHLWVPRKKKHQLAATTYMEIIEIQLGEPDENDIERFADA